MWKLLQNYRITQCYIKTYSTLSHNICRNLGNQLQWRIVVQFGIMNWTKLNNKSNQTWSNSIQWLDCFVICLATKHNQAPFVCCKFQLTNSVTPIKLNQLDLAGGKKNTQISTSLVHVSNAVHTPGLMYILTAQYMQLRNLLPKTETWMPGLVNWSIFNNIWGAMTCQLSPLYNLFPGRSSVGEHYSTRCPSWCALYLLLGDTTGRLFWYMDISPECGLVQRAQPQTDL